MSQATASKPVVAREIAEARSTRRPLARTLRPLLMLGGVAAVIVGAGWFWLTSGRIVSVTDSYVSANTLAVSTDVSGIVQAVEVTSNTLVHRGQVLFRLDPARFRYALAAARAQLDQVALTIRAMKGDYLRMQRDIAAMAAQVRLDQVNANRYASLVRSGGVTRASYDSARFRLAADTQKLGSLRDQAAVQLARLGGNANVAVKTTPQYLQALAAVHEAERQLAHSVVRAPFTGIVTGVSKLQPGRYLAAATAAFGLVSSRAIWVTANAKETTLTWVRPGDPVKVTIDAYPGRVWRGKVASISPASGSSFAILPAENSSGNWVKVVQRIPLDITVDPAKGAPPLRAGMSAEVAIDTGHTRSLSELLHML